MTMMSSDRIFDLPETGDVPCCYGVAVYGARRCTCWVEEYSVEQSPPQDGPAAVRATMCDDCAFRCTSPERLGDERYEHSEEGEALGLAYQETPFVCHQGMRKLVRLRHPSGAVVEVGVDAYDPPTGPGVAWKADGTPADVCAGYAAARLRIAALEGGTP
jgi:hypothetical protein